MIFIVAGGLAGLHHASLRGYKDSLWERFEMIKLIRSLIMGAGVGGLAWILKLKGVVEWNWASLFMFCLGGEVIAVETYKWFFRIDDQKKYMIPTYFQLAGKVIESRKKRLLIGIGAAGLMAALFKWLFKWQFYSGIMLGLIGGIVTSSLGSYKDAPFEGFFIKKFWRSWWVDILGGLIMAGLTNNAGVLLVMIWGWDRMWIELYKCLWLKNEAPGKFKIKKIVYREWLKRRNWLLIPYGLTWVVLIVGMLLE